MHTKTDVLLTALLLALFLPFSAWTTGSGPAVAATEALFAQGQPFEQDLIVTAYYSPLPDQCCYVRGNLAADVELNGKGTHGADGTAVYAGMVAAPPTYPFGTRIVLPGIGTVTVHDRGGAIQEWKSAHRLDLWAGYGEEGLARALAFGVQHIHAVVYPPSPAQPAESIDLSNLPAPPDRLLPYVADDTTLFDIHAHAGDVSASTSFLQQRLSALGVFTKTVNGSFGAATQEAIATFYRSMNLDEPTNEITERGAAFMEAAFRRVKAPEPIAATVDSGSSPAQIAEAQRTLRFLGIFAGRTTSQYDKATAAAVLAFQQKQGIVASASDSGAGRIGPKTHDRIVLLWKRKHTEMLATRLLAARKVDHIIVQRGQDLRTFLSRGDHGDDVRALQKLLVLKGYLDEVNGVFGAKTEEALVAYQKDAGIISAESDAGAGIAGPATLARYRHDLRSSLLQIVRAKGWAAI